MSAGAWISFFIYALTALLMMGIGISQVRKNRPAGPVGFYTGEQPPKKEELTDWNAWNRKHGTMWIVYGVVILLGDIFGTGGLENSEVLSLVMLTGSVVIPLPIMIWYHHALIIKYKKKEDDEKIIKKN